MLYSMNRWESLEKLRELLRDSDYIIVDRYYPSNLAYGIARGLDERWLSNLDAGLPEPDQVILVDISVEASFTRKTSGRDVHERDTLFLRKVRKAYLNLAKRRKWTIVNGDRSLAEVNEELWKALKSPGNGPLFSILCSNLSCSLSSNTSKASALPTPSLKLTVPW